MSASRQFTKICAAVWTSRRFRGLSDSGKLLLMYLMTCSHQSSVGAFRAPLGYIETDLEWDRERVDAAVQELGQANLILYDRGEGEFFVRGWYRFNPPMNGKHATGTKKRFAELQSAEIRTAAEAEFAEAIESDPVVAEAVKGRSHLDTNYMRGSRRS